MPDTLTIPVPGTLGNITGPGSDGVLCGIMTEANPTKALLKSHALAALCRAADAAVFTDYDTEINEATGDDVAPLPATPAVDDACYFGHATSQFARVDVNITTQGAGTWTIAVEYWNGSAWTAVSGLTDGTTGWTAATGWKSITFTLPTDWATTAVNTTTAYWIRTRVSAYTSVTTQPLVGQGYIIGETAAWTDDTTDFTDAGAGDVKLLPDYPVVGDGIYIGSAEKFCKVKVTTSQARTGTATIGLKYWDGSAWSAVTTYEDDSTGWSEAAGTYWIHFVPPSDWTANTTSNGPNSQAGFFVAVEMTAITDVTQQPLATQGWVLPCKTGATGGVQSPSGSGQGRATMMAATVSATNADSVFLLVNTDTGDSDSLTWGQALAADKDTWTLGVGKWAELALVQITEDGTTEFAAASFQIIID